MKKVALAAALSLAGTSAFAGGYSAPAMEPQVMQPEVVVEETTGTGAGIVVPLLLLALVAAVAASD